MAEFTPYQLAAPKQVHVRKVEHYARDPYNFSSMSVSSAPNPQVVIPATGPYSAGAPAPTLLPTIESVEIIATEQPSVVYGVNKRS